MAGCASPVSRAAGIYRMSGTLSEAQANLILAPYGFSAGRNIAGAGSLTLGGVVGTTPPLVFPTDIGGIELSEGQVSPAFVSGVHSYAAKVRAATTSITVRPTFRPGHMHTIPLMAGTSIAAAPAHRFVVNESLVATDETSPPITLITGTNTITVTLQLTFSVRNDTTGVISDAVLDEGTYTITVIRPEVDVPEIAVKATGGGLNEEIQNKASRSIGRTLLGASTDVTFTISNTDYGDLTGVAASITGPNASDFSIITAPAATVAGPTGSTACVVRFAPKTKGKKTATVRIASNDADENPFEATLTAIGGDQPEILSPADGTILRASATGFTWDTGAYGASIYALGFGSAPGLSDRGLGWFSSSTTYSTVTSPGDGEPVYATIWALVNGVWKSGSATFTDYHTKTKARLLSPANGATLSSSTLDLQWDSGTGVTNVALWVGTVPGGYDLYAGNEGTKTAKSLTIPTDKKIHVTLWSLISGIYQPACYIFNAYPSAKAELTSPANTSTLADDKLALTWTRGIGASRYAVWVGSATGGYDLGAADVGTATSRSFNVPRDGGPVYVTLWSMINGAWQNNAYWFTTAQPLTGVRPAALTAPAVNGSLLTSNTLNLTWDAGSGATQYALWVGTKPDGYDLYARVEDSSLSRTVTLPATVRRAYVTLFSRIANVWQSNAYWFDLPASQSSTNPSVSTNAVIQSPANGSTLATSYQTFTWNASASATQYALWVGRKPGGNDLYAGLEGTALSRTLSLPADGTPVYVSIFSWINGAWQSSESFYQAPLVP